MTRFVLISILALAFVDVAAEDGVVEFDEIRPDMKEMREAMLKLGAEAKKEQVRVEMELKASKDPIALAIKNLEESERAPDLSVSTNYLIEHYDDTRAETALKKEASGRKRLHVAVQRVHALRSGESNNEKPAGSRILGLNAIFPQCNLDTPSGELNLNLREWIGEKEYQRLIDIKLPKSEQSDKIIEIFKAHSDKAELAEWVDVNRFMVTNMLAKFCAQSRDKSAFANWKYFYYNKDELTKLVNVVIASENTLKE